MRWLKTLLGRHNEDDGLMFHSSNPAGVRVFRNCAAKEHLPMVVLEVTFAEFFWLVFCMPWAGILLVFECFGTVPPRDICHTGKGNVRRVFLAYVSHALGWNPAGVQMFRGGVGAV